MVDAEADEICAWGMREIIYIQSHSAYHRCWLPLSPRRLTPKHNCMHLVTGRARELLVGCRHFRTVERIFWMINLKECAGNNEWWAVPARQ